MSDSKTIQTPIVSASQVGAFRSAESVMTSLISRVRSKSPRKRVMDISFFESAARGQLSTRRKENCKGKFDYLSSTYRRHSNLQISHSFDNGYVSVADKNDIAPASVLHLLSEGCMLLLQKILRISNDRRYLELTNRALIKSFSG